MRKTYLISRKLFRHRCNKHAQANSVARNLSGLRALSAHKKSEWIRILARWLSGESMRTLVFRPADCCREARDEIQISFRALEGEVELLETLMMSEEHKLLSECEEGQSMPLVFPVAMRILQHVVDCNRGRIDEALASTCDLRFDPVFQIKVNTELRSDFHRKDRLRGSGINEGIDWWKTPMFGLEDNGNDR